MRLTWRQRVFVINTTIRFVSNPKYNFRNADKKESKIIYKTALYFRKSRKRIETLFSQLCDQFKIRNNYAKSFEGLKLEF